LRWIAPDHSLSMGIIAMTLIATVFLVVINLGTNWSIRTSDFKRVTRQKLTNSVVSNGLKWVLAFSHWGGWALILATVAGYIVSSFDFLRGYLGLNAQYKSMHSRSKTFALLKEHRDFPTMNLPIVMMDNVRDLILGVVIFGFYSSAIFGSYSHTLAMLSLPIMLVSGSLSQVLFHQLAERRNERKAMYGFVLKVIGALVALSVIPFGVLRLYGQEIFVWIFGGDWLDAGRYAEMMTFWLMLNFIFSPLAVVPIVLKKQNFAFVFSTVSAILQLMPFVWCYAHNQSASFDFEWALQTASNVLAGWFIILVFIYLRWVRISDKELNHEMESRT
jgi:teichuronic acid exporter